MSNKTLHNKLTMELVADAALATVLMTLAGWTCPTTAMFMETFSAPIFDFGWCSMKRNKD